MSPAFPGDPGKIAEVTQRLGRAELRPAVATLPEKDRHLDDRAAHDGHQAVRLARQHRPGLILMDMGLPKLSGLDATRQIKAEASMANTPIIAVTAKAMRGDREEILAAGCDDYLPKPLDPEDLTAVIRKWLS